MAGIGKRLRPFTLTTPKPLLKIAGKSIVHRLVENISQLHNNKITDVGFVIGNFPESVVESLENIAKSLNLLPHIYYQTEALGTAHAVAMASDLLQGEVIIAFADTLFDTKLTVNYDSDAVIWTKKVENPERYGVVLKSAENIISGFKEKPTDFVSDEAIIGIYYFKNGEKLRSKIDFIIDNKMIKQGEYLLTDALQMLLDDKNVFKSYTVDKWLDCGNKDLVLQTMKYVVEHFEKPVDKSKFTNVLINEPVYIDENAQITNSVVGPYAVIEKNSVVSNSVVSNSIILENANVLNAVIDNSIIGNYSIVKKQALQLSIGDYNEI
jgi:glucose-1-phosphate thymidylyltransferase